MNPVAVGVALSQTVYCLLDMLLRASPFLAKITPDLRRRTAIAYAGLCVINLAVVYGLLTLGTWSSSIIKNDIYIMGIVSALVNMLLFPGRVREHLFVYGITSICTYLITPLAMLLTGLMVGWGLGSAFLIGSISYTLLIFVVFWPIRLLLKRTVEPFLKVDNGDYWNLMCLVSLGLFLAMRFALPWNVTSETWLDMATRIMFGAVTLLICLNVAKDHRRVMAQVVLVEQLANQKAHYSMLQQQVEDARKTRHDLKHYIAAIQHYIDTDDKSGLQEYCNELTAKTQDRDRIPYTGNPAADGVLYRYQCLAAEQNTDFHFSGRIKNPGIANVDLCVVLGNALDNALTACARVAGPRQIQIFAQTEARLLSIVVRNSFDGQVEERNGELLSRKRDHEPGVGIRSMREVCRRCGGTLEYQWDENTFTLLILLPILPGD